MSVDFSWERLDESLAQHLVEALNRHLQTVTRPSFIGPVEVTGFEFGNASPDVEIVDMRDIYRDFLEEDEDEEEPRAPEEQHARDFPPRPRNASGATTGTFQSGTSGSHGREGHHDQAVEDEDAEYEWVSRRSTRKAMAQEAPAYHHLPPHMRYGRPPSGDFLTSLPGMHTPRDIWSSSGVGGPGGGLSAFGSGIWGGGGYAGPAGGMSLSVPNLHMRRGGVEEGKRPGLSPLQGVGVGIGTGQTSASMYAASARSASSSLANARPGTTPPAPDESPNDSPEATPPPPNTHPNLQLHFHIVFNSDLRLSLTTSLLINYPSPMFMALPIKLSVIGLVFDGEVVVAYEGQRKRVHLCILDDLDPYGPAADRHNRPERRTSASSTPPEDDDEDEMPANTPAKPLPIGHRLLPSIVIESEIGQVDKHVLKNVPRVEKFIQDVIRKTVEDELVFPNFHTLLLGD
ncbi:hypothetical protein SCHPADRAFT_76338 [Schizopora paradoxa]|uniref:Mitochondrial distribution and morphology protein 12 n=1 Tax=Schizopora paradoxa TaxID=27342 RepID=A0A0H2SPZ7_9AGAM|nr:hypothetical protein SCHPADRAFT_76338 [Schizopora paradoxa]